MEDYKKIVAEDLTLDPKNWSEIRSIGHEMIDDIMDYLENIRERPVWNKMPDDAKNFLNNRLPQDPQSIRSVYDEFKKFIFPYAKGNIHPRYFAWVQGAGTPFGVLADMLASTMNPNVTIGEHAAMYVDQEVVNWCKEIIGFSSTASGILLSGGSMANITALCVARNHQLNKAIRRKGLYASDKKLVLYCSVGTHSCIEKAASILGLGEDSLRKISVNGSHQINVDELEKVIQKDLEDGYAPFCIVGNVGAPNTGAIDPLPELLAISGKYKLWLHIDGAFGALAKLVPEYAETLKPLEKVDSIAFDLHKWMSMPYEIGCVLFKNAEAHRNSFAISPSYLKREDRGLASGPDPINNYGFELSRNFKALKVWMSLKEHGIKKFANIIRQNIAQAFYTGELIEKERNLELITPVTFNVVCYRYKNDGLTEEQKNQLNSEIIIQLQEQGIASPSSTILDEKLVIRLCIVNQRSKKADFEKLIHETVRIGDAIMSPNNHS